MVAPVKVEREGDDRHADDGAGIEHRHPLVFVEVLKTAAVQPAAQVVRHDDVAPAVVVGASYDGGGRARRQGRDQWVFPAWAGAQVAAIVDNGLLGRRRQWHRHGGD
jgi:hypothetical protein